MRALVIGGAGFMGGHLSRSLLAAGADVVCLDDLSTGRNANIADLTPARGFEFVRGSVLDKDLMNRLVARSDTVFHMAAAVGVELIMSRPLEALRTNINGTEIVLDRAQRHSARVLVASTSEVYGKCQDDALTEDQDRVVGSPLTRRWSYAEAKALDETLAYLAWADQAVPTVVARFFNVAGPRQTGRYGMVIPRFVDQALRQQALTVHGDGNQTRSFCHVRDAVTGIIGLIEHPGAYGRAFNIGRPEEVSIQKLAERVISLTGSSSTIRYLSYRAAYGEGFEDSLRRVPDISRAQELIGFHPRLGLDDIIQDVIQERVLRLAPGPVETSAVARSGRSGASR